MGGLDGLGVRRQIPTVCKDIFKPQLSATRQACRLICLMVRVQALHCNSEFTVCAQHVTLPLLQNGCAAGYIGALGLGCIWEAAVAAGGKPRNEGLTQMKDNLSASANMGQQTMAA